MEKNTFVLIDGNSLMNRAFYAINGFTTKDGFPTNAIYGFIKFLFKILEEESPAYLGVAFDLHAPTFRHKLYKDYKGTRNPTPEELVVQFPVLKEVLSAMRIRYVEMEGYEADDLIGTLSRAYGNVESVIYTGDRDAYQLVNEHVSVCFTKRGVSDTDRLTNENFYEKVGLTPSQIIEEKALMGDSSDNIPGVSGIGPKTALSLLQKYGTAEGVYGHLDELAAGLKNRLIAGREDAKLSHRLAAIDTNVPLSLSLEEFSVHIPFSAEARAALDKLEFRTLVHSALFDEYEKAGAECVVLPERKLRRKRRRCAPVRRRYGISLSLQKDAARSGLFPRRRRRDVCSLLSNGQAGGRRRLQGPLAPLRAGSRHLSRGGRRAFVLSSQFGQKGGRRRGLCP